MFSKSKSWMTGGVWKPKNPHSLEHLKYLYGMLCKNQTVTEQNHGLLVETLRSISEILIWGDQNDSSVFDFFLEKNMLAFFLRFMRQKSGRHICVQLLQTLNILFENISNETSVYYLLSNNHINSIIVHKFDFSDEEVMAYYISFLKTLSLKLNKHTIHFFYNEHTNDFALYTEAIKFFNHSESMVRIAVRTITLNVYRACRFTSVLDDQGQPIVDEKSMLRYIRDKTAAPYFSNLVWFIGSHVLELDACVCGDINHNSRGRLSDLVAEHLDHLHYLNDILSLNIQALNEVLTEHLINRLLVPLYVCSLDRESQLDRDSVASSSAADDQPFISPVVSLFLLSQVFLIIHYEPLVRQLAEIVFSGKIDISPLPLDSRSQISTKLCGFIKPLEPLAETLENACRASDRSELSNYDDIRDEDLDDEEGEEANEEPVDERADPNGEQSVEPEVLEQTTTEEVSEAVVSSEQKEEVVSTGGDIPDDIIKPLEELNTNSTDEEKLRLNVAAAAAMVAADWRTSAAAEFDLADRPYLSSLFSTLDCSESDYKALFALCLLYALTHNYGINQDLLDSVFMPTDASETKHHYNMALVQLLIRILSHSAQSGSKVRLVTLELAILMLKTLVYKAGERSFLQDAHLAAIEGAREEATLQMRNFYKVWEKSEEIFLDMFEDEYRETMSRPLNVEYLTMDASILLPPTGTPLTGIEFNRRLPCGEVERAKRAIRMFFLVRNLSFTLRQELETQLPLTRQEECVKVDDVLDLNNSDLIACTVIAKDSNKKDRRFLVIDILQLILVEPDSKRLGWGVVRFVGFLQDVEVSGDKDDSRCLHVTVLRPTSITGGPAASTRPPPKPLLSSRFVFDDHIRCMAARQRLVKGRLRARQRKMQMIARLLELPAEASSSSSSSHRPHSGLHTVVTNFQKANPNPLMMATTVAPATSSAIPGRSHMVGRKQTSDQTAPKDTSSASSSSLASSDVQHSVFASVTQVAAFNTAAARDQEQEAQANRRAPRLVQQRTASTGTSSTAAAAKPSAAAKKKLLSMALQAQKQRQEAALAAGVISGGRSSPLSIGSESSGTMKHASAGEANPDTASSSDTDSSPQRRQRRPHKKSTLHSDSRATDGVDGLPQPLDSSTGELESREASLPASAVRRTRTGSGGHFPKSLIPADSETVSLIPLVCDIDIGSTDRSKATIMLDSPVKLMPPADPELILKLSSLNTPVCDGCNVDSEAEAVCGEYSDVNIERVDATKNELQSDDETQQIVVSAVDSERGGNDCNSFPTGKESLEEVEADGED